MKPRVLPTKRKFRRTENVSDSGNDGQQYPDNGNYLSHQVLHGNDYEQLLVTAEPVVCTRMAKYTIPMNPSAVMLNH